MRADRAAGVEIALPHGRGYRGGRCTPMMKSCPYCGGAHDVGVVCDKKPQRRTGKHKSKAGDLRHKNIWTRKSREIRERDMHLCRWCLAQGVINTKNLSVHHITAINENESRWLDDDNLITLCYQHHEEAEHGKLDKNKLFELASIAAKVPPYPKSGR